MIDSFKKDIMDILIQDEKCLQKLISLRQKIEGQRCELEQQIKSFSDREKQLTELILHLRGVGNQADEIIKNHYGDSNENS